MPVVLIGGGNADAFSCYIPQVVREELFLPETVALGVCDDETSVAAGVLVARVVGDWLEVIWLYVGERFRGRDYGRIMLSRLAGHLRQHDGMLGMFAEFPDGELTAYFDGPAGGLGFRLDPGHRAKTAYSFTLGSLEGGDFWSKNVDTSPVRPLCDLPEIMLREFGAELSRTDAPVAIALPIKWRDYDQSLSMGFVRGRAVRGILLVERGDGLSIAYAHVAYGESAAMPAMLRRAAETARGFLPPETPVSLATINPASTGLVERLLPGVRRLATRRADLRLNPIFEPYDTPY